MTVPAALRAVRTRDGYEIHLRRLLDADRQELLDRIPGVCAQIAAAKGTLDLRSLAWALDGWGHPARYVQRMWAQEGWPAPLDGRVDRRVAQ